MPVIIGAGIVKTTISDFAVIRLNDCGILIMTAYLDEGMEEAIEALRMKGNLVEVCMLNRTPGTYTTSEGA